MTMLATLALLSFFASTDPNAAIGQARQLMNQKQYEPAVKLLQDAGTFESVYPGFALFHEREPKIQKLEEWGESPDLVLLGTSEDKHAWNALSDRESRRTFIETFWSKHDIGPPQVIRQKPLTARESSTRIGGSTGADAAAGGVKRPDQDPLRWGAIRAMATDDKNMTQIAPTPIAKGGVERWIYSRDQFPQGIPDAEAVFKFITQEGYGDHVLQREFMVNKVLADAATMH